MRIVHFILAAALATSVTLAAPALARNSDAQKGEDKSAASSTCSAYQQAPDGSWEPLPCKETGERGQPQTQNRTSQQGSERGGR
ncbi:hypothetical protein LPJ38_23115 [Bradyrhizobium daqingense]|uniref:Uncharacterized protein n=1 Tax=Bradyrhizobium daqingense TaxID=993502 RepID=A0A562LG10_9BRAD|nr:hypothetical protein [Bradyrhizobium daqingense]TWI06525.1 hypothetical protein IQ17_02740 [Bradyrhizobium daqingense]UFS86556.1 hypothetical protein LPJ38_23115 [Bradyrhizobium daqingense]